MYRIRKLRRDREWTQRYTAEVLGVSEVTYKKWEKTLMNTKIKDLLKIAKVFGVNPWEIDLCPEIHQNGKH